MEAGEDEVKLLNAKSADERIDIDETENIRTVIVNLESEKNVFDRY